MNVFLNEQVYSPTDSAETVAQVIEEVRASLDTTQAIMAVRCNGQDIAGDDLSDALNKPADHFERLDLQTGPSHHLVRQALQQALLVLDETNVTRQEVVDSLTQGDHAQATDGLSQCFGNWGQVHTAIVQSLKFLSLDLASLQVNGQPIVTVLQSVTDQLQQVKETLTSGDQVLLADQLQYEFDLAVDSWRSTIETILQNLTDPATL